MNITLESIDELRKRANVGYKEAKEALVECDGNMVEAIIYIEDKFGVKDQQKTRVRRDREDVRKDREEVRREGRNNVDGFMAHVHKVINFCNSTRFVIFNKYRTVIDIPLTLAIIIGMIFNVFAIIIVVTAIVTDHKIKFVRQDNGANDINDILNKVQKVAQEVTNTIKETVNYGNEKKETKEEVKEEVNLDKE